jgi:hypothetical protein
MKRPNTKKGFDCIGFKRKVQVEVCQEIKGLAAEEEIKSSRRSALQGPLGEWWTVLQRRSRSTVNGETSSAETPNRELITN